MNKKIKDRMPDNVKFVLEEINSNILRNYITKLQELCDKYEEEHNTTFKEWQKDIQANKEAIEYINNFWKEKSYYESVENCLKFATMNEFEKEDLIDILQGESDD